MKIQRGEKRHQSGVPPPVCLPQRGKEFIGQRQVSSSSDKPFKEHKGQAEGQRPSVLKVKSKIFVSYQIQIITSVFAFSPTKRKSIRIRFIKVFDFEIVQ